MILKNIIEVNPASLKNIKSVITKGGPSKLHVLADFDRTLTKAFVNGKDVPSLISILRNNNYLTPDYPQKAKELYKKYYPIDIDPNVPDEEKKKYMHEWWSRHFELLIKSGLAKKDIDHAMTTGKVVLRQGAKEFFMLLQEKNIPLIILSSSGLGDYSINTFLKHENCKYDNVHIISNRFEWDINGKAISVKQPIIHSMNKNETTIKEFSIYKKIKNRKNVILLGDTPGDTKMITGFGYDNLISIGFLNKETDKYFDDYQKYFDVIILNDGPMDYVNQLLKEMIKLI